MKLGIPYERIVQWSAGPASVASGWIATQLFQNANIGNTITQATGVNKASAATYIAKALVFIAGSLVAYAAHHKWLDNAAKWWSHTTGEALDLTDEQVSLVDKPDTARTPDGPSITTAGGVAGA